METGESSDSPEAGQEVEGREEGWDLPRAVDSSDENDWDL